MQCSLLVFKKRNDCVQVRKIDRRLKAFQAAAAAVSKTSSASQQDSDGRKESSAAAQPQKVRQINGNPCVCLTSC